MQHLAFQWELLGSLHGIEDVHVWIYVSATALPRMTLCARCGKKKSGNGLSNCCSRKLTCDSVIAGGGNAMSKARIPLALHSDSDEEGASVLKFGLSAVFCQHPNPKKLYGLYLHPWNLTHMDTQNNRVFDVSWFKPGYFGYSYMLDFSGIYKWYSFLIWAARILMFWAFSEACHLTAETMGSIQEHNVQIHVLTQFVKGSHHFKKNVWWCLLKVI